ncbi:MAG: radical SAM protein [Anaerolineae bacterium]|nr:radical SAM protein [Anaerolineae bacterium]
MADLKPIMIVMKPEENVEGDCACPSLTVPQLRQMAPTCPAESDCACPDALPSVARHSPLFTSHTWWQAPGLYRMPLSDAYEVVFAPDLSARVAVLNRPASHLLDLFSPPRTVSEVVKEVPFLEGEGVADLAREMADVGLICCDGQTIARDAAPDTLTAWLHVTRRCNLRCAYCYARRGQQEMSEAVGRATVDALFQSAVQHGFQSVKLKYAGGEPTLNLATVLATHEHAQAEAARMGLHVREVLLSNGVDLPRSVLHTLRSAAIGLAISLDGVGPANDIQRGPGSAERAIRSLDLAIDLGMTPHVSVTVTRLNVAELRDVVTLVLDRDLPFNLNFYRPQNTPAAPGLLAGSDEMIDGLRGALALIEERLPRRSLAGGLLDRCYVGTPHRYACGAGQSYVAVDPLGNMACCHMELDRGPIVGRIGQDDPVAAIRSARHRWESNVDERQDCGLCTWRYWCAGGCPLLARHDSPSSLYCHVYQALLPDLLRLEGLRLLRWGADSS